MAISQAELITALQTLFSTVKFRLRGRRGTAAQLDPSLMKAGEFAFCTDTRTLYACYVDGTIEQVSHGFIPKATYATLAALQAAHPTGVAADYYMVGTGPYHLYNWGGSAWVDMGVWNDMSLYATAAAVALKINLAGGSANAFTAMPYVGIAPVIESGTVGTGRWVKFADGTMICSGKDSSTPLIVTATDVPGCRYASVNIALPASFYADFYPVMATVDLAGWLAYVGKAVMTSVSGIHLLIGIAGNTGATANCDYSYLVVGRWKA